MSDLNTLIFLILHLSLDMINHGKILTASLKKEIQF